LRKKPAPPPSDQLIELLTEYDLAVGELALALRSIMLEEAPAATETVFKNYAVVMLYSLGGKWADTFCHIVVYTRHVNLGFNWGARLPDPERVLVGSGKQIRHIKIARPEDLKKPYLRSFIRAAVKDIQADRANRPVKPPKVPRSRSAAVKSARTKSRPVRK
jgi:hypothetical protein